MRSPFKRAVFLVLAAWLAIVGVRMLLREVKFNRPAAPSLAGVKPSSSHEKRAIDSTQPELGSYRVPVGWSPDGGGLRRGESGIYVHAWQVALGVPVTTGSERRRAVELAARINHEEAYTSREYVVAGHSGLEVVAKTGEGFWRLITHVFVDRRVVTVECHGRDAEQPLALQGCAAVVASLGVSG